MIANAGGRPNWAHDLAKRYHWLVGLRHRKAALFLMFSWLQTMFIPTFYVMKNEGPLTIYRGDLLIHGALCAELPSLFDIHHGQDLVSRGQ
jgi:hypothetical protein